ncbi:MAG: penicillin-binding protein activator LpoB [Treponema sp.]|nr:penicillin-binding protein activator LpoB [Treponema sp.]
MKRRMFVVFACLAGLAVFFGCATTTEVSRTESQEDLSGYWNSNDVKIVCEDLVNQCLASPRIIQAIDAFGRVPRIIVDPFRNESSEHINTAELASLMEIALDQSGRFTTVAGGQERQDIRKEQEDQLAHASEDTAASVGAELGAEFRLSGTVSANVDKRDNRTSRAYTVRVYLSDITTTERLWSGYNDSIRKTIVQSKTRF